MVTTLNQYSVAGPASTRGVICLGVGAIGEVASGLDIIATALFGGKALSDRAFRVLSAAYRRRPAEQVRR